MVFIFILYLSTADIDVDARLLFAKTIPLASLRFVPYVWLRLSDTLDAYIDKYGSLVSFLADNASAGAVPPSDPAPPDLSGKAISLQVSLSALCAHSVCVAFRLHTHSLFLCLCLCCVYVSCLRVCSNAVSLLASRADGCGVRRCADWEALRPGSDECEHDALSCWRCRTSAVRRRQSQGESTSSLLIGWDGSWRGACVNGVISDF